MSLSPAQIKDILAKAETQSNPSTPTKGPTGNPFVDNFDKAAIFLLDLLPENLYDPTASSEWWFKCKGCKAVVKRTERTSHHTQHRKDFGKE